MRLLYSKHSQEPRQGGVNRFGGVLRMERMWKVLHGEATASAFRIVVCLLVFWMLPGMMSKKSLAADSDVDRYSFEHSKRRYVFDGRFTSDAGLDCLLHIFYDYKHFKKLMSHVEDIHLDRQGDGWYEVTYTYRNLFYKAVSTFRRTLDLKNSRVTDELVRVKQSGLVVPTIHSIRGYYRMMPDSDGVEVTFHQEGDLEASLLGGFYFGFAEREAASFMKRVRRYAEKLCKTAPTSLTNGQAGKGKR